MQAILTLSVSTMRASVETRVNGVREEFLSGGAGGQLASSAPINLHVAGGENTVEFSLAPIASGSDDPSPPAFRANLQINRIGDIVVTGAPGERPIFTRELTDDEAAALAGGLTITIVETFQVGPELLRAIAIPGAAGSDGPAGLGESTDLDELAVLDEFAGLDELAGLDEFAGMDEFVGMDEFAGLDGPAEIAEHAHTAAPAEVATNANTAPSEEVAGHAEPGVPAPIATPERLVHLAGVLFIGGGAAMLLGGGIMVFTDPAGFFLIAFGLAFIGAGLLARRVFAAAGRKRAVYRAEYDVEIRSIQGARGRRRQIEVFYLDDDDAADTPAAAHATGRGPGEDGWLRVARIERPDWVAGRILAEDERGGRILDLALGIWSVFALGAIAAAYRWGGIANLVALGAAATAAALSINAIRRRLHLRKFGSSTLALDQVPARLGEVMTGEFVSSIPVDAAPAGGFQLRIQCVHRWREIIRRGSNRSESYRRRDVVWEDSSECSGYPDPDRGTIRAPVAFWLPADLPGSSLARSEEGISWEILVTAAMPGLDYRAKFVIPVTP